MKKTQEQIFNEINAYITKTSKHLFSVNDKLFTFVPFKDGSQTGYATIIVGKDSLNITARLMVTDSSFQWYGNNYPNVIKNTCFPSGQNVSSIPYFKKMKSLIAEITPQLTLDNLKNKDLADKCLPLITDLVSN